MKPYEKFLNESLGLKEIIEIYLQLRQHFQELGFSEEDLVSPPTYTALMMNLHQKFQATQKALFQQVKDYGCLLYTSPSPRDRTRSRMPSSA